METQHAVSKNSVITLPRYLFIGHPRCGSGYISKVLECYGLKVGHEFMKKHGIVSWFAGNFYDDNKISCRKYTGFVRTHRDNFKKIIHFIRDPYFAIPSIINENKYGESYVYRRDVIKFYYDINLDDLEEPNKSVTSYLYWNDLCLKKSNIDCTIKVENCIDDIKKMLEEFEYPTNLLQELPPTDYHHRKRDVINYENISDILLKRLDMFCLKYGYKSFSERINNEIDVIQLAREDFY